MASRPESDKGYLQVAGICIRDIVEIQSPRTKVEGVSGMVTGIAHGPGLTPYFRVRVCLGTGNPTESPWFRLKELTRLGDELYHLRQQGVVS